MRIVQASILAVLVVIAGFLFSISRKMSAPAPAAETAVAQAPAPAVAPAPVAAPAPAAPPVQPARAASSGTRPPARRTAPAAETHAPTASQPQYESIPRAGSTPADYSAPVYTPPPAPAPPPPRSITVPAGTAITVRLIDPISTERNRTGDIFHAALDEPLVADGVVVAHRGSNVTGRVVEARESGRVAGVAEMALEIDRINTVGGEVQIASDTMMRRADTTHGKDAATVGAMAGIGAAIGAIAGGRKGAGIGAASGGAAGAGTVMATKGKPVKLDPETRLTFQLRAPITITADASRLQGVSDDPDRPQLHRRN